MKDIHFPVYKLSGPPSVDGGCLYFETYDKVTETYRIRIIDDKNVKGSTLASRRLKMLNSGVRLYEFSIACFHLSDMLKLTTRTEDHWIDSKGLLFRRLKLKNYKVEKRKITKLIQRVGYVIVELEGESERYKSLYGPQRSTDVGLLLVSGVEKIFYGFASPDAIIARRKV